jgi:membrane-associated protease RseP (regulator of RpoE activity)
MSQLPDHPSRFPAREAMKPSRRTYLKHIFLLLLTLITATVAGSFEPFGSHASPLALLEQLPDTFLSLLLLPLYLVYVFGAALQFVFTNPGVLKEGLCFSVSLLFILTCHELGHYIACRIYGVDATLPFFIPVPIISPAGTLGAFIKILSPMPTRRATFDIGVAGPIAGFIALIPVALIAFLTMHQGTAAVGDSSGDGLGGFVFADPLLFRILAGILGINLSLPMEANPFYFAAWVGLLVTAMNLIPSGQLDGGHAVYAVFGERLHWWTGRIAFVVMATFTVLSWYLYSSPSGLLFVIILGIMMRIRHPAPLSDEPLGWERKLAAVGVLAIFVLCFAPFPIQIK